MGRVTLQGFEDSGLQFGGSVAVEQLLEGGDDRPEIGAAVRGAHEEVIARRRRRSEAVRGTMLAGAALLLDQRQDVGRVV